MNSDAIIPVVWQELEPHHAIYRDPTTTQLMKLVGSVARTTSTVLLAGESGVGKEVFARAIHRASPRTSNAFVAVNCAALPSSLLESELFGHEKGAFSGAVARHEGHFERANGGTILLDEISEVSLETQAKLLRVLQERSMLRVGGSQEIKLDVRIVATTNRNLRESVDRGEFRLDLFYRLNVFPIHIPPLRERPGDIEPLVLYYLSKFARQFGVPLNGIQRDAMQILVKYPFPGNVRELVNILERAVILAGDSEVITPGHLILEMADPRSTMTAVSSLSRGAPRPEASASTSEGFGQRPASRHLTSLGTRKVSSLDPPTLEGTTGEGEPEEEDKAELSFLPGSEPLTDVRRKIIIGTLERFDGNRTRTAEALGVSLRTIRNKLRDYRERGIDVPDPGDDG